jgi:hypothetical protein
MPTLYSRFISKANYVLFIVMVCMLPFPTKVSLYAWMLWLVSWLLEGRIFRSEHIRWHKGLVPILALVGLLLFELVSYTWAIDTTSAANMLVRHLSYIAIVPIAIWGVNQHYDWVKIARWFIISCVASIFIYGFYIYIFEYRDYLLTHHQYPEQSWLLFGERVNYLKHHLYYGNLLNLALVALLQIRVPLLAASRHKRWTTALFFLTLLILVIGVIWSGSRANMLTLLVVSAVAVIQPLRGYTRPLVASMVCIFSVVMGALLFTLHPRFDQLSLEHVTERNTFPTHQIEPRINIWYSALQQPHDYLWHGVGVGCDAEYLTPVYAAHQWHGFFQRQFNAHNQYLATLINLGIVAALFFLLIWLLYPLWYTARVRQLATLVALTIGLNMLTENMLDRIDGVIVACASMLVIALLSRGQLEK